MPGHNVFTRNAGIVRHFWRSKGGKETADPGQDSYDAPDMSALFTNLDRTPEERSKDWFSKLNDGNGAAPQSTENDRASISAAFG